MHSLLARSRHIELASAQVETPLLVPAISSKALGPIRLVQRKRKDKLVAASLVHSDTFVRGIDEALLISAYDIHFRLIAAPCSFRKGFTTSPYAGPRVLFIDSGWYEKSVGPASGQWYHEVGDAQPFEFADYSALVDSFDKELDAVLVSWDTDDPASYVEQIQTAQDFFGSQPRFSSDILLKPEGSKLHHDFRDLSESIAARLRPFTVVGVTEKELGDKILDRLTTLAELRHRLDEAEVASPIHVFGGLDPLLTPLYFAAGGEIFDGLGWLRYGFYDGMSIHRDSILLLERSYEKRSAVATAHVQLRNLDAIAELSRELKVFFHNGCDWGKLRRGDVLRPAHEAMESALGRKHGR